MTTKDCLIEKGACRNQPGLVVGQAVAVDHTSAQRAGRSDEPFMFHLGRPEISACCNPVGSFSRITGMSPRR